MNYAQQLSGGDLNQSASDCRAGFEELFFLATDALGKLTAYMRDIRKVRRHILPDVYTQVSEDIQRRKDTYESLRARIRMEMKRLASTPPSAGSVSQAEKCIREYQEYIRTLQLQLGSCITGTDWQSPSFAHSLITQSGRQTGTIYATVNDYKRDQHWDAHAYEQTYRKKFIDGIFTLPVHVHAVSSGMAAFTTILNYLQFEHKPAGSVLVGRNVYFELKPLIMSAFAGQTVEADETDAEEIIRIIRTDNPSVIFLDSLSNTPEIVAPDMERIIKFLVQYCRKETFLVIDNTALSVTFQPYPLIFGRRTGLRIIVFESLNKFHQYGMDRVSAGIIWSTGGDTGKLFDYRVHLGTNIQDAVVASLPTPDNHMLNRRLIRHGRNARMLASALQSWVTSHPESPVESIVYPGLPDHSSHAHMKTAQFTGAFFVIRFRQRYRNIPFYKRFVASVIALSKKNGVDIVSGTSFGLNTTRIYLTAVRSQPNIPFIRIAVGTESLTTIQGIAAVFLQVFEKI